MNIELIFGVVIIAIGAFASGSFSIPLGKTKGWAWEVSWLAYCLSAYILMPLIACSVFCNDFIQILSNYDGQTLAIIFMLGLLYGICNLTFGLTLRYLGLSLGFMISLGLMMVLGTIIPPAIDGRLPIFLQQSGGIVLIIGMCVAVVGIIISAYAGYRKDKSNQKADNSELDLKKGLLLALFVGVTGASQALGIEQGNGLADVFIASGTNPLFASLPTFLVLFAGSFCTTAVWCIFQAVRKHTVSEYVRVDRHLLANYLYSGLSGLLWFSCLIFFGMGKSYMGHFSFTAWGILMSLTIACATIWGVCKGEWKHAATLTKVLMYVGLFILIIASFIIGLSSKA